MNKSKKSKRKLRQRDKTAAKNIDPYFGDLTKTQSSSSKIICNYQATAASLAEMFPNVDKNIINDLLDGHKGNFDAALNSLIEMAETTSSKESAPLSNSQGDQKIKECTAPFTAHNKSAKSGENLKEPPDTQPKPSAGKEAAASAQKSESPAKDNEERKLEEVEKEEEEYTEEYKKDINELALNSIADELISKYPRYTLTQA